MPKELSARSLLIRGYFQNHQMVAAVMDHISPEIKANLNNQRKKIDMQNRIAIHVRRGDYLKSASYYGILTKQYYFNILESRQGYVLFVENHHQVNDFKNDPNLICIIDEIDADAWETLAMLVDSLELHMANSTLSWWGAKLSENSKKRITMPFPWHNQGHEFQDHLISSKFNVTKSEFEKYDD